jgi:hypothetical protein
MMLRQVLSLALAATAAGFTVMSATPAETTRTVFISVVDGKGAAITDMTAEELTVKEGGKDVKITSLAPATQPMDIVLLVDDGGTGAYQAGVLQFLQAMMGKAKFSISQFAPQAVKLVENTDDVKTIQGALEKLGPRGKIQTQGQQMVEAIDIAAKALKQRNAVRPVIQVLTLNGGQSDNPDFVMRTLGSTGVILNVVHLQNADVGQVLGDGPRQSGGRIEQIGAGTAIPPAITKMTESLLHQYQLTYTLPDGVKPSDRLAVTTKRKGVSLGAPTRIPDK